jgi:hypothetical protein
MEAVMSRLEQVLEVLVDTLNRLGGNQSTALALDFNQVRSSLSDPNATSADGATSNRLRLLASNALAIARSGDGAPEVRSAVLAAARELGSVLERREIMGRLRRGKLDEGELFAVLSYFFASGEPEDRPIIERIRVERSNLLKGTKDRVLARLIDAERHRSLRLYHQQWMRGSPGSGEDDVVEIAVKLDELDRLRHQLHGERAGDVVRGPDALDRFDERLKRIESMLNERIGSKRRGGSNRA